MQRLIDHPAREGLADWLRGHPHRGGIHVLPDEKLLCMRVPKTALSSIVSKALPEVLSDTPAPKPFWYVKYKKEMHHAWLERVTDEELRDYFIFSFVRDPWDRFLSLVAYFKMLAGLPADPLDAVRRWRYYELNKPFWNHALPQHIHTHMGDERICDFIGRFENLQEDYNVLCDVLGVDAFTLPHLRRTEHKDKSEMCDTVREFVSQKYARDIELYGYSYE